GGKGSLPSVESYQSGTVVTVKSNTVLQDGYIFTGWLDSATGKVYLANETFTMPSENIVLTAQWSHIYNPVNIPETGDISNTPLLIFLIGIFAVGMIFTRKKQERKV
ncbi:MAG: InlB B-repeat-containing protein, partial [Eubacteriales bacterium]